MAHAQTLYRPARNVPGSAIWGAFPARDGSAIRFRAGRADRRAVPLTIYGDEVQVRKWPVAARISFMVVASALLWIGIAASIGLFG